MKILKSLTSRLVRVTDGATAAVLGMCTARLTVAYRQVEVIFMVIARCPRNLILRFNFLSAHSALTDRLRLELPRLCEPSDRPPPSRLHCSDSICLPSKTAYAELSCSPPVPEGEYYVTLLLTSC